MTMTDPIADLLTRMRNVNRLGRKGVAAPYSRLKEEILQAMAREGFIEGFSVDESGQHKMLRVVLKYGPEGEHVITRIDRISRPGCRVYRKVKEVTPLRRGMGVWILSTPKGILSDNEARAQKVGGEVLCSIY
ncbi:MAG: 30S ribosomal protein S8 [Planctomycetota bacterium]